MTEENYLMKIELKHPIKIKRGEDEKEQTLHELTLDRIKAKHLKHFPKDEASARPEQIVDIVGSLAGLSQEEANEIDLEDLIKILGELLPLLKGLPGIGEIQSGE